MSQDVRNIVITLSILGLGLLGFTLYQHDSRERLTHRALTADESQRIRELLSEVQRDIAVDSEIYESAGFEEWKLSRKASVRLTGYMFQLPLYESTGTTTLEQIGELRTQSETKIAAAFEKQGATVNTYNNDVAPLIDLQTAFIKNDIRCLVKFYATSGDVFCGLEDRLASRWVERLASAIPSSDDPNTMITVQKVIGNNAHVSVGSRFGSGYLAFLHQTGLGWKTVFQGQDIPECSLVDKYKMSREFYGNCFDPTTNQTRFQD